MVLDILTCCVLQGPRCGVLKIYARILDLISSELHHTRLFLYDVYANDVYGVVCYRVLVAHM